MGLLFLCAFFGNCRVDFSGRVYYNFTEKKTHRKTVTETVGAAERQSERETVRARAE